MPPRLALLAVALFIVEFFDAPTIANLFAFISIFLLCSSLNSVSPAPDQVAAFKRRIGDLVEREAVAFFKKYPAFGLRPVDHADRSLRRSQVHQTLQRLICG